MTDSADAEKPAPTPLAIVGMGNCANSLIQGIEYYKDADPDDDVPGLMHVVLGGYHINQIELVAMMNDTH